jgi:hypothetical protein
MQYAKADRAQQQPGERAAAAAADNQQVGAARRVHQRGDRVPHHEDAVDKHIRELLPQPASVSETTAASVGSASRR